MGCHSRCHDTPRIGYWQSSDEGLRQVPTVPDGTPIRRHHVQSACVQSTECSECSVQTVESPGLRVHHPAWAGQIRWIRGLAQLVPALLQTQHHPLQLPEVVGQERHGQLVLLGGHQERVN